MHFSRNLRLSALFAATLGAVGVGMSGTDAQESTTVSGAQKDIELPAEHPSLTDRIWMHTLQDDLVSFKQFGNYGKQAQPEGTHAIALQIESLSPKVDALLLSPSPYRPTEGIYTRHAEAAASVMDEAADRLSGKDVPVLLVARNEDWTRWIMNDESAYTRTLFENADVISVSMMPIVQGDQNRQYSAGTITTEQDIRKADDFWKNSHTILVWGSGNNGTDRAIDLERTAAFPAVRADTMLRVGQAGRDANGNAYIVPYSSRVGVSFVTTEPYLEGMGFRLYSTGRGLRQEIEDIYEYKTRGADKTNAELFAEQLKLPVATAKTTENKRLPLTSCHSDFANANFPGKDVLLNNDEWTSTHPEDVREAFTNCLVSAAEYTRQKAAAPGARGYVTGMMGSSYSGPHAAGMVAAMREKYPQLSEYDLDAAALMASVPVRNVQRMDGHLDHVAYHFNGRGLLHNSYEAGFGFLDENAYVAMVDKMAVLLDAHPQLATKESRAEAGSTYTGEIHPDNAGRVEYRLEMAQDIVALRSNIALHFAGGPAGVPAKIELIDPAGGSVYLSPTKLADKNMVYSLASTDGHFGVPTKGTWRIRIPTGFRLEEARLSIAGVERRGLIDRTLDSIGHPAKPAPAPQTFKIASAAP